MIGQGTLDQRAAEGRPWLVRFKTITGLGVVGKVLQVKDTGTGPYLRVQETYTEREWKTWAAPEGVGDIHWVAADEETLELHGVDEAAPPSQEMVYTVVGDPQPTPITQDQFYLIFGVSLRPHYGPGVNNGCVGGDNLGLAHVSGCTGDCNLPESVADVAIAESWSDSEYKAGDAVVKLPPEEAVDLGLAEGETYDVHFETTDTCTPRPRWLWLTPSSATRQARDTRTPRYWRPTPACPTPTWT
jgi:hypothetical protein